MSQNPERAKYTLVITCRTTNVTGHRAPPSPGTTLTGSPGGRYFACTAARDNDPEIMPEGYPASPFDAEEAAEIVASAFGDVEAERWDGKFFPLRTREEVRAYCRASYIPAERAEAVDVPLWLTKRGVLIRAEKPSAHLGGTSAQ
jgi:hypothetical protein